MKFLLPLAAVVMMGSAPAMAAAPQLQRQEASVEGSSELHGGGFVIALLALAAAIAGIIAASKLGDDAPNSP